MTNFNTGISTPTGSDPEEDFMQVASRRLKQLGEMGIARRLGQIPWVRQLARRPSVCLAFLGTFVFCLPVAWGSFLGIVICLAISSAMSIAVWKLVSVRRRNVKLASELAHSRSNELKLQSTLDHLPGMVWSSDNAGNRKYLSVTWDRMTGSTHKSDALDWTALVHAEDLQAARNTHRIASASGENFEMEYRFRRTDGEYRWLLDRSASCRDADGQTCRLIGMSVDITERKNHEETLRSRVDELTRRNESLMSLNERAAALVDRFEAMDNARQFAQHNDRLKSEFLDAVATDLRKPIEDVCNVVGLLKASDLDEQQKTNVERLKVAAGKLSSTLARATDLSAVAEAEASQPSDFDLRLLVDKLTERMVLAAEERGLTVDCNVDKSLPAMVRADAACFRRVFGDLWTAASQLPRNGLIKIIVGRQTKVGANSLIKIDIIIKGRSVAQERLDRAFYPAEAIRPELVGLGLGPAKRMVEHVGGQIGVQRDNDGDVAFWFSLTVAELNPNYDGRRVQARLSQESLRSNLGVVLDLSLGGMRIRCNKVPEGVFDVELSDDEQTLRLRAEVAWTKRVGFRKQEAGLKFVDLSPELAVELSRLASRNRIRRTMDAA